MYHTIEFNCDLMLDLRVGRNKPLERLRVRKSDRISAQLEPYVVKSDYGLVEVADLYLSDGTVALTVPYAAFQFLDEPAGP